MRAERSHRRRPHDAVFVAQNLNNRGHYAAEPDAIRPHHHIFFLSFFVREFKVECLGIFRAEWENIAHLY